MCQEFEVCGPDGHFVLSEDETAYITLKPTGAFHTIRYAVKVLKYGGLEISGDVLKTNGESNCPGVSVQPIDKHTVEVWTT